MSVSGKQYQPQQKLPALLNTFLLWMNSGGADSKTKINLKKKKKTLHTGNFSPGLQLNWADISQARRDSTKPDKSENTFGVSSSSLLSDGKALHKGPWSQESGKAATTPLPKLSSSVGHKATRMLLFRCYFFRPIWEHLSHNNFLPVNNISWKRRHCAETCWFGEISDGKIGKTGIVLTYSFHTDVEMFCFSKAERFCFDFLTLFYFTLILYYDLFSTVFIYLPIIVTAPWAIWKYAEMKENEYISYFLWIVLITSQHNVCTITDVSDGFFFKSH